MHPHGHSLLGNYIPDELWDIILSFLSTSDIIYWGLTSKTCFERARHHVKRRFAHFNLDMNEPSLYDCRLASRGEITPLVWGALLLEEACSSIQYLNRFQSTKWVMRIKPHVYGSVRKATFREQQAMLLRVSLECSPLECLKVILWPCIVHGPSSAQRMWKQRMDFPKIVGRNPFLPSIHWLCKISSLGFTDIGICEGALQRGNDHVVDSFLKQIEISPVRLFKPCQVTQLALSHASCPSRTLASRNACRWIWMAIQSKYHFTSAIMAQLILRAALFQHWQFVNDLLWCQTPTQTLEMTSLIRFDSLEACIRTYLLQMLVMSNKIRLQTLFQWRLPKLTVSPGCSTECSWFMSCMHVDTLWVIFQQMLFSVYPPRIQHPPWLALYRSWGKLQQTFLGSSSLQGDLQHLAIREKVISSHRNFSVNAWTILTLLAIFPSLVSDVVSHLTNIVKPTPEWLSESKHKDPEGMENACVTVANGVHLFWFPVLPSPLLWETMGSYSQTLLLHALLRWGVDFATKNMQHLLKASQVSSCKFKGHIKSILPKYSLLD